MAFNKKGQVWLTVLFIVVVLSVIGLLIYSANKTQNTALSNTFTPVYCNQYEFDCCVATKSTTTNTIIKTDVAFKCPDTAVSCSINQKSGGVVHYGSSNCVKNNNVLYSIYSCSNTVTPSSTSFVMPRGYILWSDRDALGLVYSSASIDYEINGQKLVFCGRSGCTQGVTVANDNCAISVDQGSIFSSSKNNLGISYTVPQGECVLSWQSGDRVVCGNLEESCELNSDCASHTYGNKECYARKLQTYGCKNYQLPNGVTEVNGDLFGGNVFGTEQKSYSGIKSRCEVTSVQDVQCCGDADCGSGAVCDKTTFTCKIPDQVSCNQNVDCGVSQQCDYTTRKIKTPTCSNNVCSYTEKSVDCCFDVNCASGYICNADKKCEAQNPDVKVQCPFECCVGDKSYTDRICANGLYCNEHKCSTTPPDTNGTGLICKPKLFGIVQGEVGYKESCDLLCIAGLKQPSKIQTCVYDYSLLIIIGVMLVIFIGIIAFIMTNKGKGKKSKKTNYVPLYVLLGIGVLIGLFWLIYQILSILLWTIIITLIVGLVLFIIINASTGGLLSAVILKILKGKK
jgi:hypothetical protein